MYNHIPNESWHSGEYFGIRMSSLSLLVKELSFISVSRFCTFHSRTAKDFSWPKYTIFLHFWCWFRWNKPQVSIASSYGDISAWKTPFLGGVLRKLKGWPIGRPRSLFLYGMKGLDHTNNILKFQGNRIIFRGFNQLT